MSPCRPFPLGCLLQRSSLARVARAGVCGALLVGLAACSTNGDGTPEPGHGPVTSYQAQVWQEPETFAPNTPVELYYSVLDQAGNVVQDLQQSHERFIHTFFISRDLSFFQHSHHEDFYPASFEYLENGGWHQPVSLPLSGDFLLVLDFAHQNQEQVLTQWLEVTGDVAQLDAPVEDLETTVAASGVVGTLTWDSPPAAGFQSSWNLYLTDDEGSPVSNIVQWLGADAHVAIVRKDLSTFAHTHAYVEGMENMPPTHSMPHEYDGPTLPFKAVFSDPGVYKMWIQFARADAPDSPITLPFMFRVSE